MGNNSSEFVAFCIQSLLLFAGVVLTLELNRNSGKLIRLYGTDSVLTMR